MQRVLLALKALVATSLLFAMVLLAILVTSYVVRFDLFQTRFRSWTFQDGVVIASHLSTRAATAGHPPAIGYAPTLVPEEKLLPHLSPLGIDISLSSHGTTPSSLRVRLPLIWPISLLLSPSMLYLAWIARARYRNASGKCPICGYDVRATRERCPECGSYLPASAKNNDSDSNSSLPYP